MLSSLIHMEIIPIPWAKRTLDIFMSALIIALLFPVISLLLALYIIEQAFIPSSRGSLFYKETRISQGRPFTLRKIRTFKNAVLDNARARGEAIHTKNLERDTCNLTYTGRLLRQIYMDEAPQLISVLLGDMSLVGPRPTNVVNFEHDIARGLKSKMLLKAGLTGRFQTHKHVKYRLTQEDVDMEYAELCRTGSSLKILARDCLLLMQTVVTIFRAEGL